MKKGVIAGLGILAVVLIGGAVYFATRPASAPAAQTNQNTTTATSSTDTTSAAATITYTDNGFSPFTTSIKAGQSVTITNNSSLPLQFNSNPHPAHTDNPQLNVGLIAKGQSKTIVLTATGTWGYHNHLSSSDTGTITVQ
jgi:plastocyanin